jgi:hypothetical protein
MLTPDRHSAADFGEHGVAYEVAMLPKTGIYDALEPKLNAGEVELLDITELQEQLLTLIVRSGRIDHQPGDMTTMPTLRPGRFGW